jgi:hypothetical protein
LVKGAEVGLDKDRKGYVVGAFLCCGLDVITPQDVVDGVVVG